MSDTRHLRSIAAMLLVACGTSAPPTPPLVSESPPAAPAEAPPPPPGPYELHEWGVLDVPSVASDYIEVAAGAGRHVRPVSMMSARKPVLYVHLLDGATEQHFSLTATIPGGDMVEVYPPGDVDGASVRWPEVIARAEHCATVVPPIPTTYTGPGPMVPSVTSDPPEVRGALGEEIVRRVQRRHINEVRYCFEQALVHHPGFGGQVRAIITIALDGTTSAAEVASSCGDPTVDDCVRAALLRWTYPAAAAPTSVVASFALAAEPPRCLTSDRVCELHELPLYDAASAACLGVADARSGLLFYRGSVPRSPLPIAVERGDDGVVRVRRTGDPFAPPGGLVRIAILPDHRVAATHAPLAATDASVEIRMGDTALVRDDEIAWLRTTLASLGMDRAEADGFVAGWADDLYPPDPSAPSVARGPRYHDVLLFFVPEALASTISTLEASPPARVLRRAFMVRYEFGEPVGAVSASDTAATP